MQQINITDNFAINLYSPKEIKTHLDKYVIGQDEAKTILSVAIYNHYKRLCLNNTSSLDIKLDKSNIILSGPTGSGKTFLIKTISKLLGVPYYIADATSLTQAGYVGDDVESIITGLLRACDYDLDKAKCGIIFIDEIDKIAKKDSGPSTTRDVGGEGVQQALLKIVEGSTVGVMPQGGRKHPEQPLIYVDTSNILFIASGSFAGIEDIIKPRIMPERSLGFKTQKEKESNKDVDDDNILDYMSQEDIREFGMIPEFIGRFPVITNVHGLKKDDLKRIICEPNGNILDQYKTLFALDNIEFNMTDNAIDYIAAIAEYLGTGARSLRSIFETILSPLMFELSGTNIKSYTVTTHDIDKNITKRYGNIKDELKDIKQDIENKICVIDGNQAGLTNLEVPKKQTKTIVLPGKNIVTDKNGFTYTMQRIKRI